MTRNSELDSAVYEGMHVVNNLILLDAYGSQHRFVHHWEKFILTAILEAMTRTHDYNTLLQHYCCHSKAVAILAAIVFSVDVSQALYCAEPINSLMF